MLRCKEHDLAVILKGDYTGYFVTVGEFVGTESTLTIRGSYETQSNLWEIQNDEISANFPGIRLLAPDDYLQPIRPGHTHR